MNGTIRYLIATVLAVWLNQCVAYAQVVNGDFSAGATGWTSTVPPGSSLSYAGGQLTAVSDNNGGGLSRTFASQNVTTTDPGFLSYRLGQYTTQDVGRWDYPMVRIGGTFFWITPAGALTTNAGAGIDNNDAPISNVTGFTNLATGTTTIGVGVTAVDSIFGSGVARWDDIVYQELTQSPGAQTTPQDTALPLNGANALQVATNGPNNITVTLTVANGVLGLGSTAGLTITGGANNSSTVTFSGSPASINAALPSLIYTPNAGFTGSDPLDFTASGNGLTDTDTIPITVLERSYDLTKMASLASVTSAGETINYTIELTNTGDVGIGGIAVTDLLTQGVTSTPLTLTGPAADTGALGVLDVSEVWTYSASHSVSQAEIDVGLDLQNTATVTSTGVDTQSASATTTIISIPLFDLVKTASAPGFVTGNITDAPVGTVVTYSYAVTNTGNKTITNIAVSDVHTGGGSPPSPDNEALTNDVAPTNDSADGATNSVWDSLGPGDTVTFTGTYTITQNDIDTLQ